MPCRTHYRHSCSSIRNLVRWVKHTQLEAGGHDTGKGQVDVGLLNQPLLKRLAQVLKGTAAIKVTTVLECQCGGFDRASCELVTSMNIGKRPTISNHMPGEAPLAPQ